jgi:hypothetical protein
MGNLQPVNCGKRQYVCQFWTVVIIFLGFFFKLFSQLKVLTITINCSDNIYLNGFRSEQFIKHDMIYLNRFIFCYTDDINDDFEITTYHKLINNFLSSFWIDKRWIFRIIIDDDNIFYITRPDRYISKQFFILKNLSIVFLQ